MNETTSADSLQVHQIEPGPTVYQTLGWVHYIAKCFDDEQPFSIVKSSHL